MLLNHGKRMLTAEFCVGLMELKEEEEDDDEGYLSQEFEEETLDVESS